MLDKPFWKCWIVYEASRVSVELCKRKIEICEFTKFKNLDFIDSFWNGLHQKRRFKNEFKPADSPAVFWSSIASESMKLIERLNLKIHVYPISSASIGKHNFMLYMQHRNSDAKRWILLRFRKSVDLFVN